MLLGRRPLVLMPVPAWQWAPSLANQARTKFRIELWRRDGGLVEVEWFDDRGEFDARLAGHLAWPWADVVPLWFATTVITDNPGSNQTYTSPSDWDNSANSIECVGGGGSGGAYSGGNVAGSASGGGAGCYGKITNFTFATPGTTTATRRVGAGGTGVTPASGSNLAGNDGGATWFNSTTDPGNGADNSKCSGAGGLKGSAGTTQPAGGAGGATTASWGTTKNAGGSGGNVTAGSVSVATGGGGAGGTTAAGSQGTDLGTAGASAGGNGGTASGGSGSAGTSGTGARTSNPGGNGSVWGGSDGAGGGSGGARSTSNSNTATSGAGGQWGGASGGAVENGGSGTRIATSGNGKDGAVVITYTPVVTFQYPQLERVVRGLMRGTSFSEKKAA